MTGLQRGLRFNGVGALGILVQLAVIALVVHGAGLDYRAATILGVSAAVVHNFAWHRCWTWGDRRETAHGVFVVFARFAAGNGAISLAGNLLLMQLLVGELGVPPIPASLGAICGCALANYVVADRLVFVGQPRVGSRAAGRCIRLKPEL